MVISSRFMREKSMPKYDIVIFGATSFVGQITSRYLFEHLVKNSEVRWAIAGRSASKLAQLKASINAANLDIIIADSTDEQQLKSLCESTKVVVSTVGPYALYGELLVKNCVTAGTDYCDLTGEVQWIAKMLHRYEQIAKITGARIVHCCGFDSIPSDMGVYFLQRQAKQKFNKSCESVHMRVLKMKGTASGGTVASMTNIFKELATDKQLRKVLTNPYAICPDNYAHKVRQDSLQRPQYDPLFAAWIAPFIMAAINTRIVLRSNAILGEPYSQEFRYDEAMLTGQGLAGGSKAYGIGAGLAGFATAAMLSPTRWLMEKTLLPKPGEGPTIEQQQQGHYDLRFIGITAEKQQIKVKVTGDRDPGYGSTAKILGQAALCLALDINKKHETGGFWTPASLLGEHLLVRLQQHAGLTFEVIS
jgi:short subunit dehydrogenase-like uncharacterized protein